MAQSLYQYREHRADAGKPLLMLFHGTGGDENQFFELGRQMMPDARLVAPRGDVSENGALRYFRRAAEGVYDMEDLARRTEAMGNFVESLQPEGPVYGLGYSNGANILASVIFDRPELFDAVVLMHPLIPWEPDGVPGLSGKRVLVTAGRNDPLTSAADTQKLIDFLGRQGARMETVWHEGGHEVRQEELVAARAFLSGLD